MIWQKSNRRNGKLRALTLSLFFASASSAHAQNVTIQGRVLDSSGNPVIGAATKFRVKIYSPDPAVHCVLYDETHTLDLSQKGGMFSIDLGSVNPARVTRNPPLTFSLDQVISNRASLSVNGSYCSPTISGTATYVPNPEDNRKVVIEFLDPATMGTSWEAIPEMDLNPVAYAMDSRSLGGFPASTVLRVVNGMGTPTSVPALTSVEAAELSLLAGGASTKYLAKNSTTGVQLPTAAPSSPAAGSIWLDGGTLKYSDGINPPQSIGTSTGGTITGITASGALTGGGTSGAVTISLPTTGVTGFGSAVGSATSVPVIKYDSYGRLTEVTTAAISGTLPTGTSGQFLKSSGGSSWAGANILMGDLKNSDGSLPLFGTVNCSASQSMYWDSGADQIRCQNIAVGNSQISDLAWAKLTGVPNLVANAGGTPSLLTDTEANLPTVHVAGRIFFASDTKKIFRDNGTTWDELAQGSGGTLTNVLSGAGISVSGTGATRTVALDNTGKVSGTFYKVTTDSDGRVSSGASALVAGDIPNLDWAKITSGKPTTITGYAADAVVNALNTASFATGPTSAQPTGHTAGRVFIDTTLQKIQYDNGSAWIDVASNGGTGFSGSLAGEVSGTQGATQVDSINGINRSTITTNLTAVTNATDAATASRLVKRDTNGDFAGRYISSAQLNLKDGTTNVVSLKANASSATYSLQLPAAAPGANQILQSNASGVLSWINPFSGSGISVSAPITNSSGTIGITAASGSSDGYITSAQFTSFTNKLNKALASAHIFVGNASGDATDVALSGNASIDNTGKLTVTGIRDQAIAAGGTAVGQVLRYSAADTWTPQFLTMKDLRSTVTGTQALTSSCTAGKTMYWDSATDSLGCQDISIVASTQITGQLPIANGGTGAASTSQNFVFAGPASGGAGAPSFRALTSADISGGASTASPAFTGTPTAPTAAADTNTTQLATTAFVLGQAATTNPLMNNTVAVGTSLRYARADHVHPVDTSRAPAAGSTSITTLGTIGSGTWRGTAVEVAYGGTGLSSGTVNGLPYFTGTGTTMASTGAGTSGQVLTANASGVPTWQTPSAAATYWASATGGINYTGGNVGIGSASPVRALDVVGAGAFTGSLNVGGTSLFGGSISMSGGQFFAGAGSAAFPTIGFNSGNSNLGMFRPAVDNIGFSTSGTERVRIDGTGNVGIGTTNPRAALHVGGDSDIILDGSTPYLITRSTAYPSSGTEIAGIGYVSQGSASSTTTWPPQASISFLASENHSASNNGTQIVFSNTPNGSTSRISRMLIDQNGNVGIGSTTPRTGLDVAGTVSTSGAYYMNVYSSSGNWIPSTTGYSGLLYTDTTNGGMHFATSPSSVAAGSNTSVPIAMSILKTGNIGVGTTAAAEKVTVNGNVLASAYLYSSDIRLKTDITPLDNALNRVLALRGVNYSWKKPLSKEADRRQLGVIAQEVEEQFPEAVSTGTDGVKRVNYPSLVAPLIEAIRTLAEKITGHDDRLSKLEQENKALAAKNQELEKRMQRLEQAINRQPAGAGAR